MRKSEDRLKRETEYRIYEVMSMIKGFITGHSSKTGSVIRTKGRYFKITLEDVTESDDKELKSLMGFIEESD